MVISSIEKPDWHASEKCFKHGMVSHICLKRSSLKLTSFAYSNGNLKIQISFLAPFMTGRKGYIFKILENFKFRINTQLTKEANLQHTIQFSPKFPEIACCKSF